VTRRSPGALLASIAVHVVVAALILNAAFHYDFSHGNTAIYSAPRREHVTFINAAPAGGVTGGTDSASMPARAKTPTPGLVAPLRVPTAVAPVSVTGGREGGAEGGRGISREADAAAGVVPRLPDPRLTNDPHAFLPLPKTHAERVDSAVRAAIYAYNDSVARAAGLKGKEPGDWTFEKNGQKWGIDGNKIYLGKFAIPSAVLAALPIHIQGNPGEGLSDRLAPSRRADLMLHAESQFHDDEFNAAVKRIRERKDRERRDRQNDGNKPSAGPDVP